MSVAQYSEEAEESVLGAMMQSPRAVVAAADRGLKAHHFYAQSRGLIFDAILSLDETGERPDTVTVAKKLRESGELEQVGGVPVLSTLIQMCPTVTNAGHYAQVVLDHATERQLARAAVELQELAAGEGNAAEKVAEAERILAEAINVQGGDYSLLGDQLGEALAQVEEAYKTGKQRIGLKTGFIGLDRITNGLKAGQLLICAARPGMGKSLFGQNVAEWCAKKGSKVCIFSLEMDSTEIGLRMMSSLSKVDHDKIDRGALSGGEWDKVKRANEEIHRLPIYTVDGTVNVTELRARARRLQRADGLDLLIVDYLQLLASGQGRKNDSRQVEVSDISRSLKMLARELHIPIIALAQLSRAVEMRNNKRPLLSDLRDSGAIEQDADVVVFIYRDEYYDPDSPDKGLAEFSVGKNRGGSMGSFKLRAVLEQCRFVNPANEGETPMQEAKRQEPEKQEEELSVGDIPF